MATTEKPWSKGPWKVSEDDGMLVIVDRDGETLCTVGALTQDDSTWRPTDQANACAMAAAWKLVTSCEEMLGLTGPVTKASDPALYAALQHMRSAVDQARGR